MKSTTSRSKQSGSTSRLSFLSLRTESAGLALLVLFFIYALLGGGSRVDIWSLAILRPVGAMAFVIGLFLLSVDKARPFAPLLILGISVLAVIGLQLFPLPASIWSAFPGREPFEQAASLTGMDNFPRPISLYPSMTKNAFFASLLPASILLFFIGASPAYRIHVLLGVLIFALVSALIGMAQLGAGSMLYFYEITNTGSAVGLFANRNHQAALLAITPPLLVFSAFLLSVQSRWPIYLGCGIWIVIGLLILATGSRAGFILFNLSSALSLFVIPKCRLERSRAYTKLGKQLIYAVPIMIPILIAGLSLVVARDTAAARLIGRTINEESRVETFSTTLRMIADFFPVGAGGGTLPNIYYLYEDPNRITTAYVNHAHNDFLEIAFEYGLPGILLVLAGFVILGIRAFQLFKLRSEAVSVIGARAAAIGLLVLILASLVDYPLRTPSLASVAIILAATLVAFRTNGGVSIVDEKCRD